MRMLSRRTFFAAGGGLVALGAAAFGGSLVYCGRESFAALPLERLDVALADIRAPERIGRSYLAAVGRTSVEEGVLGKAGLLDALRRDCPETRRADIRAQFRADFAAGDVVVADRWVVSRSECLVAAVRAA